MSMLPQVAVIPAAGFGTRLRPLTNSVPKEMLPVGRFLALERIVRELRAAGLTRVVFVVSPAKEVILRARFGDADADLGVSFAYAMQPEMRGLGDAVLRAEPFVGANAPFVVALGDAVFEEPTEGGLTRRLCQAVIEQNAVLGLAVQRVPAERISRYGVVEPIGEAPRGTAFAIKGIVEKPAPEDAPSDFAAAARYVVRAPRVFDVLRQTAPDAKGEVQFTDALKTLLAQTGENGAGVAVPLAPGETRHDLGGLDSYFKAFAAFALADPEHGPGFRAHMAARLTDGSS